MNRFYEDFICFFGSIYGVCNCSSELASLEHQLKNVLEIHARVIEILRRIVEILHVDEDGNTLFGVSYDHEIIV